MLKKQKKRNTKKFRKSIKKRNQKQMNGNTKKTNSFTTVKTFSPISVGKKLEFEVINSFISELEDKLKIKFEKRVSPIGVNVHFKGVGYSELNLRLCFESSGSDFKLIFNNYSENTIELYWIEVFEKRKGKGSKLMIEILEVINKLNLSLRVIPVDFDNPYNGMGTKMMVKYLDELRKWYEGFGFKNIDMGKTPSLIYSTEIEKYKMVG